MGYLLNQVDIRKCVEVMVFASKMKACRYRISVPYILSVVIGSNIEFSFSFFNVLYLIFGGFQQVSYKLALAI